MILIFYAFAREIRVLRRRLDEPRPLDDPPLHGFRAKLGARELALIATGIGPIRAREAADRALAAMLDPELVITTGVAGSLSAALAPGDIVLADRIEFGPPGRAPVLVERDRIGRAAGLLRTAGLRFATGALLTSDHALRTGSEKRTAAADTGAIAVDMESGVIAMAAREKGVPLICVRAILDAIDDELPRAFRIDAAGNVRPFASASHLLGHPGTLLKIPRIVRNLTRAQESIARAVEALVRAA